MNDKPNIGVEKLKPFTKFIYTLGQLPSSYLASMSYEEQLIWLCNYLAQTVIPTVNNNGAAVTELQNLFTELQDYVNNYFDNLDVQEEIDDKLDEMAESGVLADIIADYIQLKGQLTYNSVQEMKSAENIYNGSFLKTYGFYSYNDGGGALYKARPVTNEDVVDEKTIIALNDNLLVAELINVKNASVKQLGGVENTDISSLLTYMIDTLNIDKIKCDINCKINSVTIANNKNVEIDFKGKKVVLNNTTSEHTIFFNNGKLTLKNGVFDGDNDYSITVLRGYDESTSIVEKCNFINFYEKDNTKQTHIIYIYTGANLNVTNCHFEGIKQRSNLVTTDYAGSATCILSRSGEETTTNGTSCIIDNCTFKNNWNTDSSENIVIDDFDNIKIQNDLTELNNAFVISNITSYNSGKRVVKAQSNNIIINNINCIANNFPMLCVVSLFGKNNTLSNVYGKLSNASSAIEILHTENINISNVNITNTGANNDDVFKSGLMLINNINTNISNCNITGFSNGISIWDVTDNIKISNTYLHSYAKSLYIYTRTSDSSSPASDVSIKNVEFNGCTFSTAGNSSQRLYIVEPNNTVNYIDNVNFIGCTFKTIKTTYLYGTMISNGLNDCYVNCLFDIANTADSIYNITTTVGNTKLINSIVKNVNATPRINASGDARLYLDKVTTNSNIVIGGSSKAVIQYCTYNALTGNTDSNCKLDTFDMS